MGVWETPNGVDKLGVIAATKIGKSRGVLFVKRDDQGQLGSLFVQFSFSPTRFGGWRAWVPLSGASAGLPCPLRHQQLALP